MVRGIDFFKVITICTTSALYCYPAIADTIKLKNGDAFSGKIISLHDGICVFDTRYGAAIKVTANEIISIQTDDQYNISFVNGDRAAGRLQSDPSGKTVLDSSTFGSVVVNASEILSLTRNFSEPEKAVQNKSPDRDSNNNSDKSYGKETETQAPLDFLTGSTVLLSPGQVEVDIGTSYKQSRTQYSLADAGYFQKSSYSARLLELKTSIRAGLYEGFEGYLSLPVTYSSVQDVSTNEYVRDKDSWDIADIGFGLQYQLINESLMKPAVSLTFDVTAPTGSKHYNDALNSWKDPLNNGSGHWSIAPGLAFVRTTDPAIIFGGINYRYFFAETIDGYNVKPGWVVNTYVGLGFALNEKLSVGSRFSYAYSSNLTADGETIYGSDSDPLDISLNASYRVSDNWVVSPEVTFGLNNDAGPATLSMNFKRRFN